MSEIAPCLVDPILEDARRRLETIIDYSSTSGSGLYLQQVAEAGHLVLGTLPSRPEAQQLAEIIAQQVDDVCNSLQSVTRVDEDLENTLFQFLGAVAEIQEEIPNISDGTAIEKLAAFEENLQELSARIVWHVVANGDSEPTIAAAEEAGGPSPHSKLTLQTTNRNNSSMSNPVGSTNSAVCTDTPNEDIGDSLSQSVAADRLMALWLQLEELSETRAILASRLSDLKEVVADSASSTLHSSQTLDAEETCQRGIDLLELSMRERDPRNLSNSISLFRESLLLCSSDSRVGQVATGNLATALSIQYQQTGDYSGLMEAITLLYGLLKLYLSGHPNRAATLSNLSNALMARYNREGSLLDLSEATEHRREALELCPPGHPDRALSLNNLSNALMARYEREGSLLDLSEATERYREALELGAPGHPDRALSLLNLPNALLTRYKREGSSLDLSEATEHLREALALCPPGHPDRASSLLNLSNVLVARYNHNGILLDLSEATEHHREALKLCPPGHPDRPLSLNSLSSALMARYNREGSLLDLSEATELRREALGLCPPGNPSRASSLGNLSNALMVRYNREGSLLDLSEATEHRQEALELCPPGYPDRAKSLGNLSNAILARYNREGSLLDLSEATELRREALELCPPGHPDRASILGNLSIALLTRYKSEGSLLDLSGATEHRREVLKLHPYGHPERTESLCSVSHILVCTIGATQDTSDINDHQALVQEVFEVLREAAGLPGCPPLHRLRATLQWIDTAHLLASDSMLDAYTAALDQLDIVLANRDTLENKYDQLISSKELSRCRRIGVEAACYAVRQGHMALAVELLERGRNLLFAQVGRYRVDLEELRKADEELADRFSGLSRLLDASVVSTQPTLVGRTAFEDPIERYRRVSSD